MNTQTNQLQQTASQILAAMLSNPHIYPQISDAGGRGTMEQKLIIVAIEIAENLINHLENNHQPS
ncbi:hypothetical protein VB711_04845 [Cronbergia sp. UHCC 0137]|uniref:hypothetical protein n=1 Tax=Cronbergia sp. UHCC 0137 TaxID=3110239 RepID=UPI002B221765|nr:hypothetical protein [Cronbergia sp. UHCC 0137]MEA5617166.1 hypothetical protein [Cronbergia sp. UHCC 0137]